jgi:site-specific DNA-methyltransferase (cytosine-N4-specific)
MSTHTILQGDVWACLNELADHSVDCAVTSPPYWDQRDYGFKGQIGNETTFNEYIAKLVTIFDLLKQKLKPEGVFYLNIGYKYLNKYGNTSLGMIPYRLAYHLVQDGWFLEDIIIWYKPNHMPSSVKNRFTNTHEPVFVLTKQKHNYYSVYSQSDNYSNIIKVKLQQLPFKHMASYPEKLVEHLIKKSQIGGMPVDAVILDPFAGSGTTCKVAKDLSSSNSTTKEKADYNSVMIEAYPNYLTIIKKRCNLTDKNIRQIPYQPYSFKQIDDTYNISHYTDKTLNDFQIEPSSIIMNFFSSDEDFENFLPLLHNDEVFDALEDDGLLFIGLPDIDIGRIYHISQLNEKNWIIRNMLIIRDGIGWYPVFLLVKDIKSVKYRFDLDAIRVTHKKFEEPDWQTVNFLGFSVKKSQSLFKEPKEGLVVKIIKNHPNRLPHWIIVKWKDSKYTCEEVITFDSTRKVAFYCPKCNQLLQKYHHYMRKVSCPSCSMRLWQNITSVPRLQELNTISQPTECEERINIDINFKDTKQDGILNYNGKFKEVDRINMGQSPGARTSVQAMYFTFKRYYNVKQSLVCDYLNIHRQKNGFTKKALTDKFPSDYKHTVGHWLRKDMGGSIPKPDDMETLAKILNLDKSYIAYINRLGLKIQMVHPEKKGKNPGDYLEISKDKLKEMLRKLID